MGNQNFIVINGNKYDAVTGKLLKEIPANTQPKKVVISVNTTKSVGVVDGIRRPTSTKRIHRTQAQNAVKHPQKSQTLARKAVNKPDAIKQQKTIEKPGILRSKLGVSPRRISHAKEIQKHPHVQKFGVEQARSSVVKKQSTIPVKPAPQSGHNPQHHNDKINYTKPNSNHSTRPNMFDAAVDNANSHNEIAHNHKRSKKKLISKLGISSKALAVSVGVLSFVLLAGFFAMQNVPNLSMRVAATRAGFDAKLPKYSPSGFTMKGPINYGPGQVTVTYKSNADNREYAFVQKNSNWNSDALLANFIVEEGKTYQTYQDRGRTLYIYDGSNATWIDDGIWYQVEGESGMTTDQLIRIASSI